MAPRSEFEIYMVIAYFLVLVVALYTDMTVNKVPNWLTYGGMAAGILLNSANLGIARGLSFAAAGFAVGFGVFLVAYATGLISGGGDVKLMGAVGTLTGWQFTIQVIFYTAVVGGFMGMLVMGWYGMQRLVSSEEGEAAPAIGPPVPIVKVSAAQQSEAGVEPPLGEESKEAEAGGGSGAEQDKAESEGTDQQQAAQAPAGHQTIPYGVAIAIGGFIAFYLQAPRFH